MKNLKIGFIALCGLLLTFSACKKDKDATPSNSFVVDNKSYTTDNAMAMTSRPGTVDAETLLILSKQAASSTLNNYNFVAFDFYKNELPASGTYTFKDDKAADFDTTKNFAVVSLGYNLNPNIDQYENANFDSEEFDATGSTVTISKSGSNYTFNYTLKFTDKNNKTTTIPGQYIGTVSQ